VIHLDPAVGAGRSAQGATSSGGGKDLVADVGPNWVGVDQAVVPGGHPAPLEELGEPNRA